ncbi:MAG: CC0125/CC1285 family lipoprotein [Pseudomonadota bacterium]
MFDYRLRRPRARALAALLAGGLALASCATPTPYGPATGTGSYRTGYSDEQIEADRFRISFAGNSLTSRETVERYLLFRAAELTVQNGYDYFILTSRDTEKKSETYANRRFGPDPWGYWSPYWRFYRPHYGWRSWDPFWDDPWADDFDVRTINRYEAIAEIVMGKGPKPADNVRAFDARDVIQRLGPQVNPPAPR